MSTALDPRLVDEQVELNSFINFSRYFLSSFSKEENRVAARLLLIQRIKECMQEANLDPVVENRFLTVYCAYVEVSSIIWPCKIILLS